MNAAPDLGGPSGYDVDDSVGEGKQGSSENEQAETQRKLSSASYSRHDDAPEEPSHFNV